MKQCSNNKQNMIKLTEGRGRMDRDMDGHMDRNDSCFNHDEELDTKVHGSVCKYEFIPMM